jgi:drug/metabolite transporter (DMT)-like permease
MKNKRVKVMKYIFILIYVCISVGGLVLFKLGTSRQPIGFSLNRGDLSFNISVLSILGLFLYLISFFMYMFLLTKFDLSYIAPLATALAYTFTIASSVIVFKETISKLNIVGLVLLLVGIIFVNLKN